METIHKYLINATPRNKAYHYLTADGVVYNTGQSTPTAPAQDTPTTVYSVDTYNDLPNTGQETDCLYIVLDTMICYIWDDDSSSYVQVTGGVKKIVAGDNITVSPATGLGDVTISAADAPVTKIVAGDNITVSPATGLGDVTISTAAPVTKIIAGSNVTISPTTGLGEVRINAAAGLSSLFIAGGDSYISVRQTGYDFYITLNLTNLDARYVRK
jgi:hypothetical protein